MDKSVTLFLNQFVGGGELADDIIWFSAEVLIVVILAIGMFSLMHDKDTYRGIRRVFVVFFAAFSAYALSDVLNYLYPAARPFIALEQIQPLFPHGGYDSYPSGHASFAFGFTIMLSFFRKKLGYTLIFFAFVIGVSRIAAGIHWPIDILGGLLLGMSAAFVTYYFYSKQIESFSLWRKLQFWK